MPYYVYIIQSKKDGSYYKGYSEDPWQRLVQHNNGESQYTSSKIPWELLCVLEFATKREALIKEKKLKKYAAASLRSLIESSQNKLRL